ncbi:MAG: D-alanyl-D-alanine carboxypeptidase [Thiothrix sp.]|nr:MAG: D-alanyl-D-alanine carboxypeptidase [Thiothrix sp.]
MSKSNSKYITFIKSQSKSRLITISCLLFTTLIYPGHNRLQTIILKPGPVFKTLPITSKLADYPVPDGTKTPPVAATSYIVQDIESKTILASRRPDTPLPPASITKLMTAMVALDAWPDTEVVLKVQSGSQAIGQTIDLVGGEELTLNSLLHALLIHSGNDAALTIADNYPGGYAKFVEAMNIKASTLRLNRTTFKNPSGIDQYGHVTTARDIATLASVALRNPIISDIVSKDELIITDVTGSIKHELKSTDELLSELPGLVGGKTGWTSGAGECFVSYVERDGRGIITVVLGSTDRFGDTTRLVEWVYAHHTWEKVDSPT